MISPYRVTYNTFSSEDFDLICDVAFDSDSRATSSFLSREAVASETYRGAIKHVSSYKYTESFAPTITFIDKNFGDFTMERQRKVLKWLTSKDTPSFLNVYHDDSEVVSYAILGAFTECSTYKLGNGRVVGFQCVFTSIMPYALSDIHTITKNVSSPANSTFVIDLETDEPQMPIYPRITIKQNNTVVVNVSKPMGDLDIWVPGTVYHYATDGKYYWVDANGVRHTSSTNTSEFETTSVAITNIHTDDYGNKRVFESLVKNNIRGETVVLDGANKVVSSSRSVGRIFGGDFDFKWIPMYEGDNTITVVGNCTITLDWRNPVKIGEY
jgi:hypothetical protein